MKTLIIEIILKSSTLIGSGEGFGAIIDTDVVFDEFGLPYIPAKRVKGCLKDAVKQVEEIFKLSGINVPLKIDETFGKPGQQESSPVYFSNLTLSSLKDYEKNKEWFEYLCQDYYEVRDNDKENLEKHFSPEKLKLLENIKGRYSKSEFSEKLKKVNFSSDEVKNALKCTQKNIVYIDSIIDYFTELRQQTSIDKDTGVAKKHSLRTIRVIKEGHRFYGEIEIKDPLVTDTLLLACFNLKNMGTKRNRGFGQVECNLYDGDTKLTDKGRVDKICRN